MTKTYKYVHFCPGIGFTYQFANDINLHFPKEDHLFIFIEKGHHPLCKSVDLKSGSNILKITDENLPETKQQYKFYTENCEKIFLHSLINHSVVDFFYENPDRLKNCYWLIWGYALYYDLNPVKLKAEFDTDLHFQKLSKIIKNTPNIVTHISEDHQLAVNKFGFSGKYHNLLMYKMFEPPDKISFKKAGETVNIVVGQAADISCNQEKTLHSLAKLEGNFKIFCPLSYGPVEIRNKLACLGEKLFGNRFHPLLEVMPLKDYMNFLKSMDVGIYDQVRQRGGKNIFALISMGKKIYLSKNSTTYTSLVKYGFKLFPINDNLPIEVLTPFSKESSKSNYKLSKKLFSLDTYIKKWNDLFLLN